MSDKRVVLVTGVADYWGGLVASQLIDQPGLHVIGLDTQPPEVNLKGLDFIQADVQNPVLIELLKEEQVDTLCHLAFVESARASETTFDSNVMGTMKIMGAGAEAGVRKIVLKSSTMVYGAQPTNSAFLREEHALQGNKGYGYIRDLVEIEAFCNGFVRQMPPIITTVLRFAHIVGPKCDTPMTRFLKDEEALVLLGFDPMMQIIHETDVARALVHAVLTDAPGVFNVAAEGYAPLWKLMGLAGKIAIPVLHPVAYLSVQTLGPRYAPIDVDYLRYPCVGDTAKMKSELRFTPQYTAEEALREFASHNRLRRYMPESLSRQQEEERLRDTIERRRRAREEAAPSKKTRAAPKRGASHRRKAAAPVAEMDK